MWFKALFAAFFAIAALAAPTRPAGAASAAALEADSHAAMQRFFEQVGGARELADKAEGILVFPAIVKAGIGLGGEYGEGVLYVRGRPNAYYNTVSASIGFQLGVQTRTVIIMFMTPEAYGQFRRLKGWKVGVDGSVAIITVGAGGSIDTQRIKDPVVGFILDPKGLMYNLTLEGTKISRIRK